MPPSVMTVVQDPNATGLPISIDWSTWEAKEGDTVNSATWVWPDEYDLVPDPAFVPSLLSSVASIVLTGGTDGHRYFYTCRVTTVGGAIDDRTVCINVKER